MSLSYAENILSIYVMLDDSAIDGYCTEISGYTNDIWGGFSETPHN